MDRTLNSRGSKTQSARGWPLALPDHTMWPRLIAFLVLAWLAARVGKGAVESVANNTVLYGASAELARFANIKDGVVLLGIYWVLIAISANGLVRSWWSERTAYATPSERAAPEESAHRSLAISAALEADAKAATAWLRAGTGLAYLFMLLLLIFATELCIALALLYAAWRAWATLLAAHRRKHWERVAMRSGKAHLPAPVPASRHMKPRLQKAAKFLEGLVLAPFIWPTLAAFHLSAIVASAVPFALRALGDAIVLPAVWSVAFALAAVTGKFVY